jgi:purine catabolism regulator
MTDVDPRLPPEVEPAGDRAGGPAGESASDLLREHAGGFGGETDDESALGRAGARDVPGITVEDVLGLPAMRGAAVLAGRSGLDRVVRFVNVMEVPDVLRWTRADELLLTTGYPIRSTPEALDDFVAALDSRRLAGLAVKLGRYLDDLPDAMLASADRLGFPVLQIPDNIGFDEIINQVLTEVLGRQAALLARSEQAHSVLLQLILRGGGLPEVVAALPGLLGGPVSVFHVERTGRVEASAGEPVPAPAAELFDADGLFRATTFRPGIHPLAAPGLRASALVATVFAERNQGSLVAVRTDREWDGQDAMILERGATVAALVVTRELAVAAVEGK